MISVGTKNKECEQKCCCKNNSEYKNALLNNNCFKHSMNRIETKNHTGGAFKIKQNSLIML